MRVSYAAAFTCFALVSGWAVAEDGPKMRLREGQWIAIDSDNPTNTDSRVLAILSVRANSQTGYAALIQSTEVVYGVSPHYPWSPGGTTQTLPVARFWGDVAGDLGHVLYNPLTDSVHPTGLVPSQVDQSFSLNDLGQVAYSLTSSFGPCDEVTTLSGFVDSAWIGAGKGSATPLASGTAESGLGTSGRLWKNISHPQFCSDSTQIGVYVLASTSVTRDGPSQDGQIARIDVSPPEVILGSGATVPGVGLLDPSDPVIEFAVSPHEPAHFMAIARLAHSAAEPVVTRATEEVVLLNGQPLYAGGLLRTGGLAGYPGSTATEKWVKFHGVKVTSGAGLPRAWAVWGETLDGAIRREVILRNGQVVLRSGQTIDTAALSGPVSQFAMNESGDILSAWLLSGSPALLVNDRPIVKIPIDVQDDIDFEGVLTQLRGSRTADISARNSEGAATVFFVGSVRTPISGATQEASPSLDRRYDCLFSLEVSDLGGASCPADFDGNGAVEVADLYDFLDFWYAEFGGSAQTLNSDFNQNNQIDVGDLFGFMDAWFAGCN